jgi:hypothetical protein
MARGQPVCGVGGAFHMSPRVRLMLHHSHAFSAESWSCVVFNGWFAAHLAALGVWR